MSSAMGRDNAPHGATAPAQDILPLAAPVSNTAIDPPGRGFVCLGAGTVSVVTEKGNTRSFTSIAGLMVPVAITSVQSATDVDLLIFQD